MSLINSRSSAGATRHRARCVSNERDITSTNYSLDFRPGTWDAVRLLRIQLNCTKVLDCSDPQLHQCLQFCSTTTSLQFRMSRNSQGGLKLPSAEGQLRLSWDCDGSSWDCQSFCKMDQPNHKALACHNLLEIPQQLLW